MSFGLQNGISAHGGKKNNNKETLGYGLKGPFYNSEPKCAGKTKGWYKGPIIVNSPQKS